MSVKALMGAVIDEAEGIETSLLALKVVHRSEELTGDKADGFSHNLTRL